MAENNKQQYDWFAALVQNPDLMLNDFKALGVTPDNSTFKSRNDYESLPQVQEAFKDAQGKFDKKAFDQFYDNALLLYNNYATNEYIPKATELFGYLDSEWDRPAGSKVIDTTPRFTLSDVSSVESYGIDYINKYGQGIFGKQSAREIAQQQEAVDSVTGEGLGWKPDDKTGLIDALFRPALVLASYDKDEFDEHGELLHKKGDLKYRNGLPYYETLGNRSIQGKQVLAYSDSLTREGSWLNKYDFFDSDGIDKSMIGTLTKTAFTTIPYLIPGVGEVLGAATAFVALNRVLPVLGKAIAGMAGGGEDAFTKQMNKYEGWFAKFDPSVSDNSQEHLVSFENLGNLVSSISGQLFQQRVVGSIPMLLNKSGDIVKQSQIGRTLSYGYMALTSAQDSFNTFKEAGASDMVAGWAFVANMLALGTLMRTDYGKGLLFKGSWLDENFLREPAMQAANEVREELTKGIENATSKEKAKFIQKLVNIYNKHFSAAAADTFLNRGVSEALEEVMEEGIIDVQKAIANVAQAIGVNVGDQKLDFGLSWTDVAQRYGMAAAGGFLGGGIFHLQGKWDKFLANDMVQHTDEDTLQKLTYYIAQGRGQEIRDFYRQWHAKGLLGSTSLGTTLSSISSVNGTELVSEPAGNNLSQNDVVFHTLMNYVNTIENTINKEGLLIDTGTLMRDALAGYRESDRSLRGDTLINLGVHDLLIKDVYDVATKIVAKNAELQSEINKATVKQDTPEAKQETEENIRNSETIKKLQLELDKLRERRDLILSGQNNWKYIGQAIFASNTKLAENFIDLSPERYSQVKLGRKYSTLTEDEKKALDEDYKEYMKDSGKNKVLRAFDLYLGLSQRYAERLEQENESLKGYSLNENVKEGTRFQEEFVGKLREWQNTAREYNALLAKEDKTADDVNKQAQLKSKLDEIELAIKQGSQNSFAMLIHPSGDNRVIVDLLSKGLLTSEESGQAYALVKQIYQNYASDRAQLNNDYEYQALLRNTVSDFLSSATIGDRVDTWIDEIQTRESNQNADPGMWASWLMDAGLYEDLYNEDDESTNYNAQLLTDVKRLASIFLENLGVNNKLALNSLAQIRAMLQEKGFSSEDINQLIAEITPQYIENGQILPVTKFIEDIDKLRSQIKYSSFLELLQDFSTDLLGDRSSLLDLFEDEKRKLANSSSIEDYVIRNAGIKEDLQELQQMIKIVKGVIKGTVDKTNSSINSAKAPLKLAELDENTARILYRQAVNLENEIRTLIGISDLNGSRILRLHEDIDKHMRGRFIWTLVNNPTFVQKFGEKFFTVDGQGVKTPVNIKDICDNLLQGRIDLSKSDTADPGELFVFEVNFETALYDAIKNSSIGNDDQKIASELVDLFADAWKMDTTKMDVNIETISPYSLLSYLQVVLSMPAETFYSQYTKYTQDDSSKFAPIYNQEMALRHVAAEIANPILSNAILDELKKRVDVSKIDKSDKQTISWLQNLNVLKNFVIVPGGSGCGKTTAVAENAAKMYNDYDHEYVCLAPENEQAENLANSIGQNIRHTNKAQFFKSVFGLNLDHYRVNQKTGHKELVEIATVNDKLFDKSKKLKVLFIDEVSLFTESELKLISDYAVKHGIIVVGLGDPLQNSGKVFTDEYYLESGETKKDSQKTWKSSGLEDCIYFGSSYLTASLRPTNIAKYDNFRVLNDSLDKVMQEWKAQRWLKFSELDGFVPDTISLHYFETGDSIYGDHIVPQDVDLVELSKKYLKQGKVTIITDNLGKYQNLPEGVELKEYSKMQGMETDFVLVDVDFAKNNTFNGAISKYAMLRDFYTITQRSRIGTIVKDNGLIELNIIENSSPAFGQPMVMGEQDIQAFKQRRGDILSRLTPTTNFFDFVHEFESVTTDDGPAPTNIGNDENPNSQYDDSGKSGKDENSGDSQSGSLPPAGNSTGNPPAQSNNSVPPPVPSTPQPNSFEQSPKAVDKKTSTKIYNSQFATFLYGPQFREIETNSPNSLVNWKDRNGWKDIKIAKDTYQKIISCIGSKIRTGLDDNGNLIMDSLLRNIIDSNSDVKGVNDFASSLKQLFKQVPEIHISEFDGESRIITAIYSNGEDFVQIPIGFTKLTTTGIYRGKFKRNQSIKFVKKGGGEWRTIEQFLQKYPGVTFSDEWGVLTENFNKENNKGKLFVTFTDEPAYIPYLWEWYKRDGEWTISHYKDITDAVVQKPVNPLMVLKFITTLHNKNLQDPQDIELLMRRGLWEDPKSIVGYLTGNDLDSLPTGADYYKTVNGRAYQALPKGRGMLFMHSALKAAFQTPDFANMQTNLTMFMHFFSQPNDRIREELHGLILSYNNKSYIVKTQIEDGHIVGYKAIPYENDSYDENDERAVLFQREKQFPLVQISRQLLGTQIPVLEFIRLINPINTDGYSMQKLSSNDNIYMLFGTQQYNWNDLQSKMLSDQQFINGVYVNDPGADLFTSDSAYRRFTGTKDGYWIKGDIWGTVWSIDEDAIQPITSQPNPINGIIDEFRKTFDEIRKIVPDDYKITFDKKLNNAISRIKAGESQDAVLQSVIQGINNNMAFTRNDWKGYKVISTDKGFKLEQVDNFDLWIDRRIKSLARAEGIDIVQDAKIEVKNNQLNNWKYADILVTLPDNTQLHGLLLTGENGQYKYEKVSDGTYAAYEQLQSAIEILGDTLLPISKYLHSLVFKYQNTRKVDPLAVAKWIDANSNILGNFSSILNNYLEQRIINNEC